MVPSYLVGIIIYFPAVVVASVQRILWRSDQVTMSFTCVGLDYRPAPQEGTKKEQQSLSKAHYFYFKINIISKSTTAFVLTRI